MVLAEQTYELTRQFPLEERYGLSAQMRRASVSIPSCIAEGNARASIPDYLRFLAMSAGSLAELRTQTQLSVRLGLASEQSAAACTAQLTRVAQLLQKLQASLRQTTHSARRAPPSRFPVPGSRT